MTLLALQHGHAQPPPSDTDQQGIVDFLNKHIGWYQQQSSLQQIATSPDDIFFINSNQPTADQATRLAFEFAHAKIDMEGIGQAPPVNSVLSDNSRMSRIAQVMAKLSAQSKQVQSRQQALRQKLDTAPLSLRKSITAEIATLQSARDMLQARQDALQNIFQFSGGSNGKDSLAAQIDALQHTLPASAAQSGGGADNKNIPSASVIVKPAQPGIWGLLHQILTLTEKRRAISLAQHQTSQLQDNVKQMQAPLSAQLVQLVQQNDAILDQQASASLAVLVEQKDTLDDSTKRFKQIAAVLLPISKESILLAVYQKNLQDWQQLTKNEYSDALKGLAIRLAFFALFLAIVIGMFELWRRAILRYITDIRKRYQFLLLRRIAFSIVIALMIILVFVSGLGSLATYVGLLTAGVAVAMQNVILSIVGYFMLIGKFGVRVGDRVQVSGVSGRVVEIGLIRIHVMELGGMDADAQPTGRVVAIANSVVFQPTAALFKQAPGSNFVWHEVSLTFAPDSDYNVVENRMTMAVQHVFLGYKDDLERIRYRMELNLSAVAVSSLEPRVRFRITAAGIETVIRFPAEFTKAAEIDEKVTQELLRAIEQGPPLKVVAADIPAISLKTGAEVGVKN